MTRPTTRRRRSTQLAFETIRIEGGLIAADWISRIAQLKNTHQSPDDYNIIEGLELREEIGRAWRIANASWANFELGMQGGENIHAITTKFVVELLQKTLDFDDLKETIAGVAMTDEDADREYDSRAFHTRGGLWPITAIDDAHLIPLTCAPGDTKIDDASEHFGTDTRKRSAFGALQEYLNVTENTLWGLTSNGYTLRLVRDNASLTRPAWIEFDLQRMFGEERYADFAAMWLLIHRSRFGHANERVEDAILEQWRNTASEEGIRARNRLRSGFEDALRTLGQGFLAHPDNQALRDALADGSLTPQRYFNQLLRLVYRMLFLLVIEDRELLHPPKTSKEIRERYAEGYSLLRLRDRAVRRLAHDKHHDLWTGLSIVWKGLAHGQELLGIPALSGIFDEENCRDLDTARLDNASLLFALFRLCWLQDDGLVRVNWRDMDSEELGYIYEGLLELVPQITDHGRRFAFATDDESRGNVRKTTGSYYTPTSLVTSLLDTALQPIINKTISQHPDDPVAALLNLTIVDPACGSGHFLLASARRLAEHVARQRSEGTPTPDTYRQAVREVVSRCIYGVDLNPLAVELCKVALWMEAIEPGRPLTFLDAHIQCGNSLLGVTKEEMGDKIPTKAFDALEGDDKKIATSLRARNRTEIRGQSTLQISEPRKEAPLAKEIYKIERMSERDLSKRREKEAAYAAFLSSQARNEEKLIHDAWCAAFFWPRTEDNTLADAAPTTDAWRTLRDAPNAASDLLVQTTRSIAREHNFFHWDIAFPHIMENKGFDVVLANPPWERVKLQEKEFFAQRDPDIAKAPNKAQRTRLINKLQETDAGQVLYDAYVHAKRSAEATSLFLRHSEAYPLMGRGDINTYAVFAERNRNLLAPHGRLGIITPTGIATDSTTQHFFGDLVEKHSIVSLYDFENSKPLFEHVHRSYKFCLLTLVGSAGADQAARFAFFLLDPSELADPEKTFKLTADEIALLNPNTKTCPVFRSRRDADITLRIYKRAPILINENDEEDGNPWGIKFMTMFHMSNDSHLFHTREELEADGWELKGNVFKRARSTPPPPENPVTNDYHCTLESMLPLYEAKMMHLYDTRWATYTEDGSTRTLTWEEKRDRSIPVMPRYWVHEDEVAAKLDGVWDKSWMLGYRWITNSTNERTFVTTLIPRVGAGNSLPLIFHSGPRETLVSILSSFINDFVARQKLGGSNMTFGTVKQFPMPTPDTLAPWKPYLAERVDRLNAQTLSAEKAAELRAELDAAAFQIYGLDREDIQYVMSTFPIVERQDREAFDGVYRTKELILEKYDALLGQRMN